MTLVFVSLVLAVVGVVVQGRPLQEMFFFVVALAVAPVAGTRDLLNVDVNVDLDADLAAASRSMSSGSVK